MQTGCTRWRSAAAEFLFNYCYHENGESKQKCDEYGPEDVYEYEIRKRDEKIEMDRWAMELAKIKAGENAQMGMKLGLKVFIIWGVGRGFIEYFGSAVKNAGPILRFLWKTSTVAPQVRSDTPQEKK